MNMPVCCSGFSLQKNMWLNWLSHTGCMAFWIWKSHAQHDSQITIWPPLWYSRWLHKGQRIGGSGHQWHIWACFRSHCLSLAFIPSSWHQWEEGGGWELHRSNCNFHMRCRGVFCMYAAHAFLLLCAHAAATKNYLKTFIEKLLSIRKGQEALSSIWGGEKTQKHDPSPLTFLLTVGKKAESSLENCTERLHWSWQCELLSRGGEEPKWWTGSNSGTLLPFPSVSVALNYFLIYIYPKLFFLECSESLSGVFLYCLPRTHWPKGGVLSFNNATHEIGERGKWF